MTVRTIKREKGHLLRLTFDSGENALLDVDFCAEACIHEGDEISREKLKEYTAKSDYLRAKQRALWLLDRYQYSERRLLEKLKKAGFSEQVSRKATDRLKDLGLIDDKILAARFSEECARRGVSKREAFAKLSAKGLSFNVVREALNNTDFDEAFQINGLLEKKYKTKLLSGDTDKVYAALVRKGFSYGAVRDALKKYSEELELNGDI